MKKKNRDVVFRRINGRIVPIKLKKGQPNQRTKSVLAGAAVAGGGVAFSLAAGKTSKKANELSLRAAQKAGKANKAAFKAYQSSLRPKGLQMDLFKTVNSATRSKKLRAKALKLRSASLRFEKVATKSKLAALVIGGSLIGAGVERVLEASNKKENIPKEISKDFVLNIAGGAAAAAFVLGSNKFGVRKGSRRAVTGIWNAIKKKKQLDFGI